MAVTGPVRLVPTARRDRQPIACPPKRLHIDLQAARLVRGVRDKAAVARGLGVRFDEPRLDEWLGLATRRQRPDIGALVERDRAIWCQRSGLLRARLLQKGLGCARLVHRHRIDIPATGKVGAEDDTLSVVTPDRPEIESLAGRIADSPGQADARSPNKILNEQGSALEEGDLGAVGRE